MSRYQSKYCVIDAVQFDGTPGGALTVFDAFDIPGGKFVPDLSNLAAGTLAIPTLEGTMTASADDWIIKGTRGEFYPCKPGVFAVKYEPASAPPAPPGDATAAKPYQDRVHEWVLAAFGAEVAADKTERCHRFFEEAAELIQSVGCTAKDAHALVDYVYGRPAGEQPQEVGGVMVTLASLCTACGITLDDAAESELARVWTKVEKIRAKHAAKPRGSVLPGYAGDATAGDTAGEDFWSDEVQASAALAEAATIVGLVPREMDAVEWLTSNGEYATRAIYKIAARIAADAREREASRKRIAMLEAAATVAADLSHAVGRFFGGNLSKVELRETMDGFTRHLAALAAAPTSAAAEGEKNHKKVNDDVAI